MSSVELIQSEDTFDANGHPVKTFEVAGEPLTVFEGRATRSVLKARYDLVPREAVDAIARRLALGALIHGENNWKRGGAAFRKATVAHLMNHLFDYLENGNEAESNTDAIICNAAFLCYFERLDPFKPSSSVPHAAPLTAADR